MIQRHKSFLLVWLLALLQCFVPLLHAHAGGLNGDVEAHIHLDELHVGALHDFAELHVDHSESPAVSAPSEFRRDQFFSGDDLVVAVDTISQQPATPAAVRLHLVSLSYFPVFHRLNPPAQAPPVASSFLY